MDAYTLLEHQMPALRQSAESEIRSILSTRYAQQIEPGTPLTYYLDFKTDSRLLELKEVLEQIDSGSYGRCVLCKQPIPGDQLKRLLLVKLCDSCATEHVKRSRR